MISGAGAGIGNFLLFYPAAYYFAMLTGRNILIQDGSLIGEMCHVINCGFPHYSSYAKAFPSQLSESEMGSVRGIKAWDFNRHLNGESIVSDRIVRADGYKYQSGWYGGHNYSTYCIAKLTGCAPDDVSCHDRHALQQLIRGPFLPKYQESSKDHRLVGAPHNLVNGILTLPHNMAPRLDAAVHLRCQFKHFEFLVGPEDTLWANYMKEVDDWLNSDDQSMGIGLFKVVEAKIMDEMAEIIKRREARRRRILTTIEQSLPKINLTLVESMKEASIYSGDESDTGIYVYLASDNERVKEAFAHYLVGHANITVLRVHEEGHTVHAKNIDYLKQSHGTFPLVMDWYAMSLANTVFAYRRDTHLLSTFAQVLYTLFFYCSNC